MPSEGSDLPTVKQCKFEQLTSKSDAESEHSCYNNEPEYFMEGIKNKKEMNISIPEKDDDRDNGLADR